MMRWRGANVRGADGWRASRRPFFEDDGGFSTVGMVLALLVTLSLVFSGVQVYRVQSVSADVQNVADASALAAENQVAAFYTVARVCDAVVLTMSLTGVAVAGVGAVALCVPPLSALGSDLIAAAARTLHARDTFSRTAAAGLDKLQRLLPFTAALQAYEVAVANAKDGQEYLAIAMLVPSEGESISSGDLGDLQVVDELAEQADAIANAAERAEEASKRADEHKLRAFMADCGSVPDYCMAERAERLAGMTGAQNPLYSSVDAWTFSVALARAKAYYPRRLALEAPLNSSVEEESNSALRKRFYAYACDEIAKGYVHESGDSFDAYFPVLPKNTAEMRQTPLYDEVAYPITESGEGVRMMHAYAGCPAAQAQASAGLGSVRQLESGGFEKCPVCGFAASSIGSVAAASTSIQNGFEHHYRIVAEEAAAYEAERDAADAAAQNAKGPLAAAMEGLRDLASRAANARIEVSPPGRHGAIAIAACLTQTSASSLVPNGFVADAGVLGPRLAIAASSLADDAPDETKSLITSLFDGFIADSSGIAAQGLGIVLDLWSGMLMAHLNGVEGLKEAVRTTLDGLPLVGHSGLGAWAAGKLQSMIEGVGLAPANLAASKPVLVNSWSVLSLDDGAIAQGLRGAKEIAASLPPSSANPLGATIAVFAGIVRQRIEGLDDDVEIASIQIIGEGGPSIPVTVTLPQSAREGAVSLVDRAAGMLQMVTGSGDDDVWR